MLKLIPQPTVATSPYLNKPLRSYIQVFNRQRADRLIRLRMVRDAKARADLLRHNGLRLAKTFNPSEYNPV